MITNSMVDDWNFRSAGEVSSGRQFAKQHDVTFSSFRKAQQRSQETLRQGVDTDKSRQEK